MYKYILKHQKCILTVTRFQSAAGPVDIKDRDEVVGPALLCGRRPRVGADRLSKASKFPSRCLRIIVVRLSCRHVEYGHASKGNEQVKGCLPLLDGPGSVSARSDRELKMSKIVLVTVLRTLDNNGSTSAMWSRKTRLRGCFQLSLADCHSTPDEAALMLNTICPSLALSSTGITASADFRSTHTVSHRALTGVGSSAS